MPPKHHKARGFGQSTPLIKGSTSTPLIKGARVARARGGENFESSGAPEIDPLSFCRDSLENFEGQLSRRVPTFLSTEIL